MKWFFVTLFSLALGCSGDATPSASTATIDQDQHLKVGWYEFAPDDHRLLTFAADGGMRLIGFGDKVSSQRFEPLSSTTYRWHAGDSDGLREAVFVIDGEQAASGFAWTGEGNATGAATRCVDPMYSVQEISYQNGDVRLSGSLFIPEKRDFHCTAIMIHGSGESDRDNLWYMWIAHALVSEGIAVLLPDKRGSGKSGGDWTVAAFKDFAKDTEAAVDEIRDKLLVDSGCIGLLGISQGGWIAPLTASTTPNLSFVINVSGPLVTPNEQLSHELKQNRAAIWFAKNRRSSWWKKNGEFDPIPYWKSLYAPGLVVYGEEDENDNVPVIRSAEILGEVNKERRSNHISLKLFAQSGHGLFEPGSGSSRIRQDFLDLLVTWILKQTETIQTRH